MVLLARPIGEEGHRYYLRQIGSGRLGERQGDWLGRAASLHELSGPIDDGPAGRQLGELLAGCAPTGETWARRRPGRVAAVDLMFAAPKSVSLAHGLGSADVADAVRAAHERAVRSALGYLERESAVVRQGASRRERADGVVCAEFLHRVSRADDPHLHSHVLLVNLAPGPSGRWTALHTPILFSDAATVGAMYHAALRHGITQALGWSWADTGPERGELLGVPRAMIEAFSQRTVAIRAMTREARVSPRHAADLTRPARTALIDHDTLAIGWHERADALGFPMPTPARIARPRQPAVALPARDFFTRADALRAWCAHLPEGAPVEAVEQLTEHALRQEGVIALEPRSRRAPARLDRPDGPPQRFTTRAVLDAREVLLRSACVELVTVEGALDGRLGDALLEREPRGAVLLGAVDTRRHAARFERLTGIATAPVPVVTEALTRWRGPRRPAVIVNRGESASTVQLAELSGQAARAGGHLVLVTREPPERWSDTFAALAAQRRVGLSLGAPGEARRVETKWLGRAPASLVARARWYEAAQELHAYRESWGLTADTPLGPPPRSDRQRAERRQVERTLARARALGRDAPGLALGR